MKKWLHFCLLSALKFGRHKLTSPTSWGNDDLDLNPEIFMSMYELDSYAIDIMVYG